ncbi:MAG: nodulation protein NfeD [Alphaproteobacteria bacterium]
MAAILLALGTATTASARTALLLDVDGPIGPATGEYIEQGLTRAAEEKAALVIIRMDTPGGLDTSMRAIIKNIIASPVPVATFVPSGGRAASAGTYILFASHVAVMAPGTNLGSATPVRIGGPGPMPIPGGDGAKDEKDKKDKKDAKDAKDGSDKEKTQPAKAKPGMEEKVLNDAVAYIRSLARLHGRNEDWAARAVTEAASLPANEAAKQGVIDLVVRDVDDLMAKIDARTVTVLGKELKLDTKELALVRIAPDWRTEFLSVITNPNVAYILLMIGVYGLILEFYAPGTLVPGVTGGIALLLGLYALQLLPVNYAGLALTLLGIALIIAETFVPSFGVLGFGGIVAFVVGSVILFDTDSPGFGISWWLVGTVAAMGSGIMLMTALMLGRSRRMAVVAGPEEMVGSRGTVVAWSGGAGNVRVHSELWRARSRSPLEPGQPVRVVQVDGLTLDVEPQPNGR